MFRKRAQAGQPVNGCREGLCPFAGSRDSVPCGVWGNAPTVIRALNSKEAAYKGAGSEASLPVTLRFLRSAPSCSFHQLNIVAPSGRDRAACLSNIAACFRKQGISPLRRRPKGFAVALWKPSQCTPMLLDFACCRGNRACGRDKGGFPVAPLPPSAPPLLGVSVS